MTIYRGIYPSQLPVLESVDSDDIVLVKSGDTFYQTSVAAFISAVHLEEQASQTQFEDVADAVNTKYKYSGRPRFDITTGKWIYAQGSGTTDPWLSLVDESVVYTPS